METVCCVIGIVCKVGGVSVIINIVNFSSRQVNVIVTTTIVIVYVSHYLLPGQSDNILTSSL